MRWLDRIKIAEFSLGLSIGVLVGWMWLAFLLGRSMEIWQLAPTVGNRIFSALIANLGLVLFMGLAGFLTGLLIKGGRWGFALSTTILSVVFRSMIHIVIGDPHPPWRGVVEVAILLMAMIGAVFLAVYTSRLAERITQRGEPKSDEISKTDSKDST